MPPISSSEEEDGEGLHHDHSSHSWVGHYSPFSRSNSAGDGDEAEASASEGRHSVRRRLSNVPKLGAHSALAQVRWARLRRDARLAVKGRVAPKKIPSTQRSRLGLTCERIVKSKWFERLVAAMVILNGVCTALDVDLSGDARPWLKYALGAMEHAFVFFFCAEAATKAIAFGPQAMMASRNYRFEVLLAVVGAADLWLIDFRVFSWLNVQEADFGLNVLPLLRVVRFVKVFKTGELALISRCLFPAFGTLVHVAMFLFIIIFMFSIPLARLVGQNPIWVDTPEVTSQFGTVPRTVFALLQMVINPDTGIMRVLYERQAWTAPFFVVFVGMTTFTIMSIMFGSVTDCYKELRESQKQRDGRAEREKRERIRADLLRELREVQDMMQCPPLVRESESRKDLLQVAVSTQSIFCGWSFFEADRQEVGLVSALSGREFKKQLQSPQFRSALQSLEVDQDTVEELLRLLEIDGGAIRYEEFVSALGLVGEHAKATHVLWLRAHLAEDIQRLGKRVERMEGQLTSLLGSLQGMEDRLSQKLDAALMAMGSKEG